MTLGLADGTASYHAMWSRKIRLGLLRLRVARRPVVPVPDRSRARDAKLVKALRHVETILQGEGRDALCTLSSAL